MDTPYGKLIQRLELVESGQAEQIQGTLLVIDMDGSLVWHPEVLDTPRWDWEHMDRSRDSWVWLGTQPSPLIPEADLSRTQRLCRDVLMATGGQMIPAPMWMFRRINNHAANSQGVNRDMMALSMDQVVALDLDGIRRIIRGDLTSWLLYLGFFRSHWTTPSDVVPGDFIGFEDPSNGYILSVMITHVKDLGPIVADDLVASYRGIDANGILVSFRFNSYGPRPVEKKRQAPTS